MPTSLLPYQQRVVDEHAELDSRLYRLTAFCDSAVYEQLPIVDRELLQAQLRLMTELSSVLVSRIERFSVSAT